ncbi:chromosome segregation protein SMC [Paraglaciecola chathamensis]|uniref:chromosome segregation protein SMC n=1 Tax=Paraglaciecola chathamensis TaxID=368405 RepID=UPI0026FF53B8|nr:chromosome segregation protein SMC [Paraglaciecola chathamensis]MDO6840607.1 chromosome segregation protein SMC [Paraglaciecola chathamensis]
MRLKKIKLAGFKSFVDPTSIPFVDDMTAIVGPNGCGKSNVIDAVRWVLGESSAKNLRGDAMIDVIFNGSSARKPVSQCTVELVFDNTSGRIQGEFASYNEISVKRLVTKDGQSSYFLNNAKCRRRDVTDLFLGTGLGPRSYAIIEQGTISRLIESKPQELRVFIEEAAGISKYKERRRETENRIRHTKENLERLDDVRGELGAQLQKLEKQAAAAKRYKELKQQERQLRNELAAIRWSNFNTKIVSLEQLTHQQEADLEAFIARQRGDEKEITLYRTRQQDLKQQLQDSQQAYFRLGTDITRLEQNQLHSKQRISQINQELGTLNEAIQDSEAEQKTNVLRVADLTATIDKYEPEHALAEQALEDATWQLQNIEERTLTQQNQWREQEQTYQKYKQQAQSYHGKIQSILAMQMRSEERISEIKSEINSLDSEEFNVQIEQAQAQQQLAQEQHDEAQLLYQAQSDALHQAQLDWRTFSDAQTKIQGELHALEAQINALQGVQDLSKGHEEYQQKLLEKGIDSQPWQASLSVAPGWESAVEAVSAQLKNALLVQSSCDITLLEEAKWQGIALVLDNQSGHQEDSSMEEGTLSSVMGECVFPQWMADIRITKTREEAVALRQSLGKGQSVVSADGLWIGENWALDGCSEDAGGSILRANMISTLESKLPAIQQQCDTAQRSNEQAQQNVERLNQSKEQAQSTLSRCSDALSQKKNHAQWLTQQQQTNAQRSQKLQVELQKQQEILLKEQADLAETTAQTEELAETLLGLEDQQTDIEKQREALNNQLREQRHQVDNLKAQLHQGALTLKGHQGELQNLKSIHAKEAAQLQNMHYKKEQLNSELTLLSTPLDEQGDALQTMLLRHNTLDEEQKKLHSELGEIEHQLDVVEKGQQGINAQIHQMQQNIQASQVECEGYRVRAKSVIEQLNEAKVQLQPLLEKVGEATDEKRWQEQLDRTVAAVARLGAVNLAAVEEYDVQAQRKQHLDEQNQDLESALETLEQAIRKIDKETRTRFKNTFDRVNNGLQTLFPKVFGGGSAYLALTDDDLLETGVSIMARPPGKKNSTIHLLSGGEKALTALSLVFAIFQLNPAPFCLLDEVDAPLDDANVGRFCKLVSEMSASVQFIYITHNKIAMEMASHLTGVTMAEPGVSRMVAVDVEQALAIAQA